MPRANIYKATLGFPAEKQGGERGKHRGVAEYSKKSSGANKDPEVRAGVFHHLSLSTQIYCSSLCQLKLTAVPKVSLITTPAAWWL